MTVALAPLRIRKLQLATNLLLAPLAGYTDLAFRLIVRSLGGVGLGCTDLLAPGGVLRQNAGTLHLTMTCPEDQPLAMQLFGADEQKMAEAARWCEDHGAQVLDINMGCPAPKITEQEGGSALLRHPDKAVRLAECVRRAIRIPLTVKLRLGWNDRVIVAPELARGWKRSASMRSRSMGERPTCSSPANVGSTGSRRWSAR